MPEVPEPPRWNVFLTFEVQVTADRATDAIEAARKAVQQPHDPNSGVLVVDFGASRITPPDVASGSAT